MGVLPEAPAGSRPFRRPVGHRRPRRPHPRRPPPASQPAPASQPLRNGKADPADSQSPPPGFTPRSASPAHPPTPPSPRRRAPAPPHDRAPAYPTGSRPGLTPPNRPPPHPAKSARRPPHARASPDLSLAFVCRSGCWNSHSAHTESEVDPRNERMWLKGRSVAKGPLPGGIEGSEDLPRLLVLEKRFPPQPSQLPKCLPQIHRDVFSRRYRDQESGAARAPYGWGNPAR